MFGVMVLEEGLRFSSITVYSCFLVHVFESFRQNLLNYFYVCSNCDILHSVMKVGYVYL